MPTRKSFPLLLAVLALILAPRAVADKVLTLETVQNITVQGEERPEQRSTAELWIGADAVARDDGETRVVLQKDRLLLVSHRAKTYSAVDLPVDVLALVPEERHDEVAQQMEEARLDGSLTPSEETQELGGWTAKRYDMSLTSKAGMQVEIELWASEEVEVDPEPYLSLTRALATLQPGGDEWVQKLSAVKGFPVERDTTMSAEALLMQSKERLISVQEKDAPAGIYDAPEGYTEQPLNAMAGASGG